MDSKHLKISAANDRCNKEYTSLIFGGESRIFVAFFGCRNEKRLSFLQFQDSKKFVDDIPEVFKKIPIKAVTFNVHLKENVAPFKSNYEFCKAVKDQFDGIHIPYYFMSTLCYSLQNPLLYSNVTLNPGERIVFIGLGNEVAIGEFRYGKNGHEFISYDFNPNERSTIQTYRRDILGRCSNPKNIIICPSYPQMPFLDILQNEILKTEAHKVIVVQSCPIFDAGKFAVECAKWICDNGFTSFHLIPRNDRKYCVGYISDKKKYSKFAVGDDLSLPYETTYLYTVEKSIIKHFIGYSTSKSNEIIEIETFCLVPGSIYSITLKIDINNFVSYSIKELCADQIKAFPTFLNTNVKSKIPVIGLYSNISVICVQQNDKYGFCKTWNKMYGNKLFISFDAKKPKFFGAAFEAYDSNSSAVVWDILSIMSQSPEKITVEKSWGFNIEKDSENPVLLEFDNYDGTKKAASPSFLMALLLKEHFKAIEKEVGEKPQEIGFCIFEKKGQDRVKNGLEEACKLLKVECIFVEFE